ncbi:MAG: YraN family protein, partial [Actinomycetota bacterium]
NYRRRYGEIDIIARQGGTVAFVEVKARRDKSYGEPFEAVGPRKQRQLRRMAQMWLAEHERQLQGHDLTFRFDVISMVLDGSNRPTEFMHIKNAF